ncbi:hypothetical protein GA0061105_106155 [Rhizobium aethiopicum]|uniref:Uncharacterized protein n=1 Tax=Rhizobium aethiopicum TaxID=1138170 RepID=A0A1C3Y3U0_9HYPH|nr:hypothetical protein GA0061105_106155 [Rhizobium aethiopicum]
MSYPKDITKLGQKKRIICTFLPTLSVRPALDELENTYRFVLLCFHQKIIVWKTRKLLLNERERWEDLHPQRVIPAIRADTLERI